jgi:hypothetical protein
VFVTFVQTIEILVKFRQRLKVNPRLSLSLNFSITLLTIDDLGEKWDASSTLNINHSIYNTIFSLPDIY